MQLAALDASTSMLQLSSLPWRALKQRATRIELLGRESDGGFDEGAFRHRSRDEATLNAVKEKILLEGHVTEAVGYGGEGAAWMQHQGEGTGRHDNDQGADLAAKIATTRSATLHARNRRQGTDAVSLLCVRACWSPFVPAPPSNFFRLTSHRFAPNSLTRLSAKLAMTHRSTVVTNIPG